MGWLQNELVAATCRKSWLQEELVVRSYGCRVRWWQDLLVPNELVVVSRLSSLPDELVVG